MWMNEYDIEDAVRQFRGDPVLGAGAQTLANLVEWTNANSDGWPYWQKPARAADRLMSLIQDEQRALRGGPALDEVAVKALYKKALVPIKAFRTRQGADFAIIEADKNYGYAS